MLINTLHIKIKPYFLPIVYVAMSLLLLWPNLIASGFILRLDLLFTPTYFPKESLGLSTALETMLHFLSLVIGGEVLEKLTLIVVLTIIPIATYRLLSAITHFLGNTYISSTGVKYLVSLFALANPFIFSRLAAGQWQLIVGFGLVIYLVACLLEWRASDSRQESWKHLRSMLVVLITLPLISAHSFVIALLLISGFLILAPTNNAWSLREQKTRLKQNALMITVITIGYVITTTYSNQLRFGPNDLLIFATQPHEFYGTYANLLWLEGFWANANAYWFPQVAVILSLSLVGLVKLFFVNKRLLVYLLVGICISLLLAAGTVGDLGAIFEFFYLDIPFLRGFREPQKLLFIYYLFLLISAFIGINTIYMKYFANFKVSKLLVWGIWLMMLLHLNWQFAGTYQNVKYPEVFEATQNELLKFQILNKNEAKLLVLPWLSYLQPLWHSTRIAEPSERYFAAEVLSAGNEESLHNLCKCVVTDLLIADVVREQKINYIFLHKLDGYGTDAIVNLGEIVAEDDYGMLLKVKESH